MHLHTWAYFAALSHNAVHEMGSFSSLMGAEARQGHPGRLVALKRTDRMWWRPFGGGGKRRAAWLSGHRAPECSDVELCEKNYSLFVILPRLRETR